MQGNFSNYIDIRTKEDLGRADKNELIEQIRESIGEPCATCLNEQFECSGFCDNYEQYEPNEWWKNVLEKLSELEVKAAKWDDQQTQADLELVAAVRWAEQNGLYMTKLQVCCYTLKELLEVYREQKRGAE